MERKTCPGCGCNKPITDFNWKIQARGIRQVRCRTCTRAQVKRHYEARLGYYLSKARKRNDIVLQEQRRLLIEYLQTHPCVDCGETDIVCLEFDHVRGKKRGNIGSILGDVCWAVIEEEIAKCEVRCANCHRRKTNRQRGWYRSVS